MLPPLLRSSQNMKLQQSKDALLPAPSTDIKNPR